MVLPLPKFSDRTTANWHLREWIVHLSDHDGMQAQMSVRFAIEKFLSVVETVTHCF